MTILPICDFFASAVPMDALFMREEYPFALGSKGRVIRIIMDA